MSTPFRRERPQGGTGEIGGRSELKQAHAYMSKGTTRCAQMPTLAFSANMRPGVFSTHIGTSSDVATATASAFDVGAISSNGSPSVYAVTDSEDGWVSASDGSVPQREAEPEPEVEVRVVELIQQVAGEVQRQRGMFVKMPRRSYTDLPRPKPSLLSRLLKPDPNVFSTNHRFCRDFSSQDRIQHDRQACGSSASSITRKGSIAPPQMAMVFTQALPTRPHTLVKEHMCAKRCPRNIELEESDGEDENTDNGIQVSHSLAHQKLAALAALSRRHSSTRTQPLTNSITTPIPLTYPYNLPAPIPPMTPRTTRRRMLSTELSESLRRNLLWERQVSRNYKVGYKKNSLSNTGDSSSKNGNRVEGERMQATRIWTDDYHFVGW